MGILDKIFGLKCKVSKCGYQAGGRCQMYTRKDIGKHFDRVVFDETDSVINCGGKK